MKCLALALMLLTSSLALSAETGSPSAPTVPAGAASRSRSVPSRAGVSSSAIAAPAAKKPVKGPANGVAATVRTDGAMVYDKADFDANVLSNLHAGDHVRVSAGVVGEFAKFHKVRVGSVVGWIAEIDVQVDGAPKKRDHRRGAGSVKDSKDSKDPKDPKKKKPFTDDSMPIFFTKYVGLVVGLTDFNEDISGVDSKSTQLVYGLKVTGPDVVIRGPVMDWNLLLHYGAPSYYSSLSSTPPKGFFIVTDVLLLYPFFNRDKAMITFGLGPLLKFSNFQVTNGGNPQSLTELDAGLSLALSGAAKFGKIAVRLEAKYVIEKHSDKVFQLAVQQEFK